MDMQMANRESPHSAPDRCTVTARMAEGMDDVRDPDADRGPLEAHCAAADRFLVDHAAPDLLAVLDEPGVRRVLGHTLFHAPGRPSLTDTHLAALRRLEFLDSKHEPAWGDLELSPEGSSLDVHT